MKLLAACLFLALSAGPAAANPAGPIRIDSCDVKKVHSQMGLGDLFVKGKGYNFFNVTFTNTGSETVKHIVFQIEFDKSRYLVGDEGSFAPGQQVTHRLRDHGSDVHAFAREGGNGATACSVQAVTFSNGTSWSVHPQS
ncbi:MAG TPA: hypothetical protein VFW34_08660 [Candidatus Rubrimentiphilum sp.]|nr:hypothetical protein [Candidatus Rubrimentiphilum sp.]